MLDVGEVTLLRCQLKGMYFCYPLLFLTLHRLVPGDIIQLKSGNVAPADCKLISGGDVKVDQSVLTGERVTAYL